MNEENQEQPEPVLTEEEIAIEDEVNKRLAEALHMNVESAGRFKLMVIPNEDPLKATVAVVFLPRKRGLSQTAISVSFVDIAGFILEVSKQLKKTPPVLEKPSGIDAAKERMMIS